MKKKTSARTQKKLEEIPKWAGLYVESIKTDNHAKADIEFEALDEAIRDLDDDDASDGGDDMKKK